MNRVIKRVFLVLGLLIWVYGSIISTAFIVKLLGKDWIELVGIVFLGMLIFSFHIGIPVYIYYWLEDKINARKYHWNDPNYRFGKRID